jgi:hypothetical protein
MLENKQFILAVRKQKQQSKKIKAMTDKQLNKLIGIYILHNNWNVQAFIAWAELPYLQRHKDKLLPIALIGFWFLLLILVVPIDKHRLIIRLFGYLLVAIPAGLLVLKMVIDALEMSREKVMPDGVFDLPEVTEADEALYLKVMEDAKEVISHSEWIERNEFYEWEERPVHRGENQDMVFEIKTKK